MARHKPTGIRPWKGGWQAYIQINHRTFSKSFPLTTPLEVLRDWRVEQQRRYGGRAPGAGSFAADIAGYLTRVSAMPTVKQRTAHLELWLEALGRDRARHSITPAEIDQVLQGWLLEGLAPATVRKRRTALLSLFHRLDGKQAPNPVRASANPREPKPEARGLDYATIDRILAAMPESRTKRRVTVIAYTGMPPGLLMIVQPTDVQWPAATVRVSPRRKGAGVEARTLSLLPQGLEALRAFHEAHAYGRFAIESANRSFKRACRRAGVSGVHLYDLRHSFGALAYRVTKDLATVGRFLLHASPATTARYAQAAMQTVDQHAAAAMGAALEPGRNLSPTPVPEKKPKKHKRLRRVS